MGSSKKEVWKNVTDQKIKDKMIKEFVEPIMEKILLNESTLINGVKEFLKWCKEKNISMAVCTNKTRAPSSRSFKKDRYL